MMNTAFTRKIATLWFWSLKTRRRSGKDQVLCHHCKLKTYPATRRHRKKKKHKTMKTKTTVKSKPPRQIASTRRKCQKMITRNPSSTSTISTKNNGSPSSLTMSLNQEANLNLFIQISTTELNHRKVREGYTADSNQTKTNTNNTKTGSNPSS